MGRDQRRYCKNQSLLPRDFSRSHEVSSFIHPCTAFFQSAGHNTVQNMLACPCIAINFLLLGEQWKWLGRAKCKELWGAERPVLQNVPSRTSSSTASCWESNRRNAKASSSTFARCHGPFTAEKRWPSFSLWRPWWTQSYGLHPLVSSWGSWYLEWTSVRSSPPKLIINTCSKQ